MHYFSCRFILFFIITCLTIIIVLKIIFSFIYTQSFHLEFLEQPSDGHWKDQTLAYSKMVETERDRSIKKTGKSCRIAFFVFSMWCLSYWLLWHWITLDCMDWDHNWYDILHNVASDSEGFLLSSTCLEAYWISYKTYLPGQEFLIALDCLTSQLQTSFMDLIVCYFYVYNHLALDVASTLPYLGSKQI